jgi:hypothetical protein
MTPLEDAKIRLKEADIWIKYWKEERNKAIDDAAVIINSKDFKG